MADPIPHPVTPPTIAYERPGAEAIPGVMREGDLLIVPRGGDVSRFCFCCAKPAAGKPVTKRLWGQKDNPFALGQGSSSIADAGTIGVIFLALAWILGTFWHVVTFFSEYRKSRTRVIIFGLCDRHRRKRTAYQLLFWLAIPLAIPLFVLGIRLHTHNNVPLILVEILCVSASIFLFAAPFFVRRMMPGPIIKKENPRYLWVEGADSGLLNVQAVNPVAPGK